MAFGKGGMMGGPMGGPMMTEPEPPAPKVPKKGKFPPKKGKGKGKMSAAAMAAALAGGKNC